MREKIAIHSKIKQKLNGDRGRRRWGWIWQQPIGMVRIVFFFHFVFETSESINRKLQSCDRRSSIDYFLLSKLDLFHLCMLMMTIILAIKSHIANFAVWTSERKQNINFDVLCIWNIFVYLCAFLLCAVHSPPIHLAMLKAKGYYGNLLKWPFRFPVLIVFISLFLSLSSDISVFFRNPIAVIAIQATHSCDHRTKGNK